MTKTEFINRVLLIMNEAGMADAQGNSFLGADSAQIDRYIEGTYENAWRMLAVAVPKSWLTNKSFAESPMAVNIPDGTGFIVLPSDFYLMSKLKMQGWQKPVFEASVEDERVSAIQSNRYTRGSVIRPVATVGSMYGVGAVLTTPKISAKLLTLAPFSASLTDELVIVMDSLGAWHRFTMTASTGWWEGSWDSTVTYNTYSYVEYQGSIYMSTQENVLDVTPGTGAWILIEETKSFNNLSVYQTQDETLLCVVDGSTVTMEDISSGINQILKYYSLPPSYVSHVIEEAIYVPNVTPLTDLGPTDILSINQRIIEPLAYVTAGSVFTIFQKDQLATNLIEKGLLMVPGYRSVKGTNITIKQ